MVHTYVIRNQWMTPEGHAATTKQVVRNDYRCPYCGANQVPGTPGHRSMYACGEWGHGWVEYECGTACVVGREYKTGNLYILAETDRTAICESVTQEDIV